MNRTARRVTTLGAALVVGCALSVATARASEPPEKHSHIVWHDCRQGPEDTDGQALDEAGARCAEVDAPLDYSRPARGSVRLAIARLTAPDTAHRIGSLFINLGGPGNPVLGSVPLARQAMGATGDRFDIVGMDPRFTGRSQPLDCGWPNGWLPHSSGVDRRGFERMVALTRDLARRCAGAADKLPYISAANIARDMDTVRAALGETKLSYLGYSQGTYLGAGAAPSSHRLPPDRARRGPHPRRVPVQAVRLRGRHGERVPEHRRPAHPGPGLPATGALS